MGLGKQAHLQREIKAIYTQDERLRANGMSHVGGM